MAEIKEYKNLINGEWKESKEKITIYSPIDNKEVGKVQAMTHKEIDDAMAAAKAAMKAWREVPIVERAKVLYKAAELLEKRKNEIGEILAREVAKNLKSAVSEVVRTADLIRYTAEEGIRVHGEVM